jgi:hypothetical protein
MVGGCDVQAGADTTGPGRPQRHVERHVDTAVFDGSRALVRVAPAPDERLDRGPL